MKLVKIDKIIESVIEDVLNENGQPFMEEFKAFIEHVMLESCTDDDVIERVRAIRIKESDSDK
jgi:hypothetical protein